MNYVDGFVAAVPTANRQTFEQHCKIAGEVFKEHGALRYVESWGDEVPHGELTSFPMAVKCGEHETAGKPDAIRWQTTDLWRLPDHCRGVMGL